MKLVVNRELCEANGVCVQLAPQAFELDDRDVLHLRIAAPRDEAERDAFDRAVRSCPRAALSWER